MEECNRLERFVLAQSDSYALALDEIKRGKKIRHWMWYIFPQLQGLGHSGYSVFYGIEGLSEAKAYLLHSVLGKRLIEISEVLLTLETNSAIQIFGDTDALKLKSSMTLFYKARPDIVVFKAVLNKFFDGADDDRTMQLL